ncbi:MAG TPA: hypothetical protein VHE35_19190, partial [Kofleriaceae bacterium]|nr:hypothetical protein [Kofleriaceae bacterium]
ISAWLDVADDLAVIAWIGGDPARWSTVLTRVRDRAGATAAIGALGLAPALAQATVTRERAAARLTIVVTPKRLARSVARALAYLRDAPAPAAAGAPTEAGVGSPR